MHRLYGNTTVFYIRNLSSGGFLLGVFVEGPEAASHGYGGRIVHIKYRNGAQWHCFWTKNKEFPAKPVNPGRGLMLDSQLPKPAHSRGLGTGTACSLLASHAVWILAKHPSLNGASQL